MQESVHVCVRARLRACVQVFKTDREREKGGKSEQGSGHTDPISPPVKVPHASLS